VVRGARARWRIAVPTAILELLTNQTASEAIRRTAKVGAERQCTTVDARLYLSIEERLRAVHFMPAETPLHRCDGRLNAGFRAIDSGCTEELHRK